MMAESISARVTYFNNKLSFFLDSYLFPIVSVEINITGLLKTDRAWIGFTAATSLPTAYHDLIQWKVHQMSEAPNIDIAKVKVSDIKTIKVKSHQLTLKVWDNNKIDGDKISIRVGDQWLISRYLLSKEPKILEYTLSGLNNRLILYADNEGKIPPNTASISIDDGHSVQTITLEADLNYSQAIQLNFVP